MANFYQGTKDEGGKQDQYSLKNVLAAEQVMHSISSISTLNMSTNNYS